MFVSVNNSLSSLRASVVHFVVDYDCQPPVVVIESPSVPATGENTAHCHLSLTQAVPLWLEPKVSIFFVRILLMRKKRKRTCGPVPRRTMACKLMQRGYVMEENKKSEIMIS